MDPYDASVIFNLYIQIPQLHRSLISASFSVCRKLDFGATLLTLSPTASHKWHAFGRKAKNGDWTLEVKVAVERKVFL